MRSHIRKSRSHNFLPEEQKAPDLTLMLDLRTTRPFSRDLLIVCKFLFMALLVPAHSRRVFTTHGPFLAIGSFVDSPRFRILNWLCNGYVDTLILFRKSYVSFLGIQIALQSPGLELELNNNSLFIPKEERYRSEGDAYD